MLLSVPAYDFGWQSYYVLAEPLALPKGTRIDCLAHYDNSTGQPRTTPTRRKAVRWGDQTFEEMMIGYIDYSTLPRRRRAGELATPSQGAGWPQLRPQGVIKALRNAASAAHPAPRCCTLHAGIVSTLLALTRKARMHGARAIPPAIRPAVVVAAVLAAA